MWYLAVLSVRSLGVAMLAMLVLRLCRVRSASARHAVWTVVTAVMLLQIVVTPVLPALPIRILAPTAETARGITPNLVFGSLPVEIEGPPGSSLALRLVAEGIYVAIAFVMLLRLMVGYSFVRRLVRNSTAIEANSTVRVRESASISVPVTVGQIAPVILLPTDWREWDASKLGAVLAHEEAHVRRADWIIGVMAAVNACIFWFHPVSWWLKRQLAQLAEFACDDEALGHVGDREQYARILVEIAGAVKPAHGRLLGNAMPMAKETNVQKRMDKILDETRTIPRALGRRGWVALLLCGLPVAYFASAVELAPAQTIAQAIAASPYQRWLEEEVPYLISDQEKAAFNRLTTDEERQMFIGQFWLRRDPTPGTEENEMKEEHYRRIAFANDRFSAGIAGWQTDRGAVYIRYGPPDALDTHGATPSTDPYETWSYRYIEGLGSAIDLQFVDRTRSGLYQLNQIHRAGGPDLPLNSLP